jgi:serine/threonine-protein kinase
LPFAWRNLRVGRANVRGAARLTAVCGAAYLGTWLLLARHSVAAEIALLTAALGRAVLTAGFVGLMYLAIEPAVRRRWPWRVVGWNRLLDGRWRDPLVGRDVLIGGATATATALVGVLGRLGSLAAGGAPSLAPFDPRLVDQPYRLPLLIVNTSLFLVLNYYLVFYLLGQLVRRDWLAAVAVVVLFGGPWWAQAILDGSPVLVMALVAVAQTVIFAPLLLRGGLLAVVAGYVFWYFLWAGTPLTLHFGAWYGPVGLFCMGMIAALATYGCLVSLGGRPLLGKRFFGEE